MPYKNNEDGKKARAKHYQDNKEAYRISRRATRERRREFLRTLMTPCEMCGDFDVAIMDWHHLDPDDKVGSISALVRLKSMKAILDEISKCICLCANCHRKLHYYNLDPVV